MACDRSLFDNVIYPGIIFRVIRFVKSSALFFFVIKINGLPCKSPDKFGGVFV